MRVIAGAAGGRPLLAPPGRGTRPTSDRLKQALFSILGDAVPDADVLDLYAGSGALGIEALSRGARSATFVERDPLAARILRANLDRCGYRPGAGLRVIVGDVEAVCRRLLHEAAAAPVPPAPLPLPPAALPLPPAALPLPPAALPLPPAPSPLPPAALPLPPARSPSPGATAASPVRFTLALADPPYASGEAARILALLAAAGAPLLHPAKALVAIEHASEEEMPDAAGNLRLIRRRAQGRGCVSVYGAAPDPRDDAGMRSERAHPARPGPRPPAPPPAVRTSLGGSAGSGRS